MTKTRLLWFLLAVSCATPTSVAPPVAEKLAAAVPDAGPAQPKEEDPYLWLEEVTSERSLTWVKARNEASTGELTKAPGFTALKDRFYAYLASKDDIPWVAKRNRFFYNFWTDGEHQRGLWRRVPTLEEYKKPKPNWETVLDLDALGAAEKENWVWHGAQCLFPKYERCLLSLSRGGADAVVVREFDTVKKAFLPGGFTLPEAKSTVAWKDLDTVYVATDFGPGSMTDSGYPRVVKEWKRGTPLASAKLVFEGKTSDISVSASREFDHGKTYDLVSHGITFEEGEQFLLRDGKQLRLDVPLTADATIWNDQLIITVRDDWAVGGQTLPRGTTVIAGLEPFLAGKREFQTLYAPAANSSMTSVSYLKNAMVMNVLEDVHNQLWLIKRDGKGVWSKSRMPSTDLSSAYVTPVDAEVNDDFFMVETGFTQPTTLSFSKPGAKSDALKKSPSFFAAGDLQVEQHFATSKDGTKVPYFQIAKKGLALDGAAPTMLTGYGGFEYSLEPGYSPIVGIGWLERGGVLVQANIRGGGEYGPGWHRAAELGKRQNAYDDFIAIAEDLIARKVTSSKHLAIEGASNGGLLMGVMLTQRPDLFAAVWSAAPLLDMKRYHKLLAGASWVAEYGNPDEPEAWGWLQKYSPYQNVNKPGVHYPRVLFTTSTRDDRVHPGHARKMAARMLEQHHDVLFWENIEGGHGGAVTPEQSAFLEALGYTFLARQVGLKAE